MKRVLLGIVVAGMVVWAGGVANASVVDLVTNGDFASGIASWTPFSSDGGGSSWVSGGVLSWSHVTGTSDGNAAGVYQVLNQSVSSYTSLAFSLDVMPSYQTLAAPGWAGGGTEYPVHFQVNYTDTGDVVRNYEYGFYYSGNGGGVVPGAYVPQNTWFSATYGEPFSMNLFLLPSTPKTINSITIYGNGWDYSGSADNVRLLAGSPDVVPEPGTIVLIGMGLAGLMVRKRRTVTSHRSQVRNL